MAVYMKKLLPVCKDLQYNGFKIFSVVPEGKKPVNILILNLMTTIEATERGIIEKLCLSDVDTELTFIHTENFLYSRGKRTQATEHYKKYYKTFADIRDMYFDGLVITGAPCNPGPDNLFWDEYREFDAWAKTHVKTELHICWGAFASIMQRYGAELFWYNEKLHGVYETKILYEDKIFYGFPDEFLAVNSRNYGFDYDFISKTAGLKVLAKTKNGGPTVIRECDCDVFYSLLHFDYIADTLEYEYLRDINKGNNPNIPACYYVNDNPDDGIRKEYLFNSFLIFDNWLKYYC